MLQDVLLKWDGREVAPMDVYADMFHLGDGYIQRRNEPAGEFKANPIGYYRQKDAEKGAYRIFFEDTFEETLKELQGADFTLLNGITYFGRKNVQAHASKMFAMIFDVDGVTDETLNAFMSGACLADAYPIPNYVALSGSGVHLYYVFEEPIPLFPNIKFQLKELKYALTDKIWNMYTSTEKKVQHQGINQGFRVLGAKVKEKYGDGVVRVFQMNTHPFSLSQLCEYVPEKHRVDETKLWRESKYTLEQAKKKFPDWYEKVVLNGDKTPKYWDIAGKVNGDNPYALYDWWRKNIFTGASYGHRYFAIMALAIYGAKCDVPEEKVRKDAMELVPFLNDIYPKEPFSKNDCESALECFDDRYKTFPIRDIERITGIRIERNKRNGRTQAQHIKLMNFVRDEINGNEDWRNKKGRPKGSGTAKSKVQEWRQQHPEGKKVDCHRDTGLDPKTIRKWWEDAKQ